MSTDPSRASVSSRWRYWKTPVLFGIGLCVLQLLLALVRFGSMDSWDPAELLFAIPAILSGTAPVLSGRPAGRVAGATPLERSCRILAQRVMGRNRGGDSFCRTAQPCRRIARPPYGGYRCSRSVSAPGRNPAVDPAILAASSKSGWTGGVISARARIEGCVHQRQSVARQYWSSII